MLEAFWREAKINAEPYKNQADCFILKNNQETINR